jgi:hypothetical protein
VSVHSLTITLPQYDHSLEYAIDRQASALVIKPQFDYQAEEFRYVGGNFFKRLTKQLGNQSLLPLLQTNTQKQITVNLLLHQIQNLRPARIFRRKNTQALHWPDEVAPLVFEALRVFGYDAVRLNAADTLIVKGRDTRAVSYNFLISLDHLGSVIGEIVREWQKRVLEENDIHKRHRIQEYLGEIGELLVPETVGKKENRVNASDSNIKRYYYERLFACEQAKALLKETANLSGCRRWQVRLPAVCDALSIPLDPSWWGFSKQPQVLRQLLYAKESAILLTARHFSPAKEQTIRNILSR